MNTKIILSSFVVALTASLAMAEEPEDKTLPTVEEIEEAWKATYEFPHSKWGALPRFFKRVGIHRTDTNVLQEVTKVEEVLISKMLSVEPATTEDFEENKEREIDGVGLCMRALSDWPGLRNDTNLLMRIADRLGEYHPLLLIPKDALLLANKIENYIEYGTDTPPKNGFRWKRWSGPIATRVAQISRFRRSHNATLEIMRERVILDYHYVILETRYPVGFSPHSREENEAVWAEFARRAKVTEKELAYAEGRIYTGEQATTRGVGQ